MCWRKAHKKGKKIKNSSKKRKLFKVTVGISNKKGITNHKRSCFKSFALMGQIFSILCLAQRCWVEFYTWSRLTEWIRAEKTQPAWRKVTCTPYKDVAFRSDKRCATGKDGQRHLLCWAIPFYEYLSVCITTTFSCGIWKKNHGEKKEKAITGQKVHITPGLACKCSTANEKHRSRAWSSWKSITTKWMHLERKLRKPQVRTVGRRVSDELLLCKLWLQGWPFFMGNFES